MEIADTLKVRDLALFFIFSPSPVPLPSLSMWLFDRPTVFALVRGRPSRRQARKSHV